MKIWELGKTMKTWELGEGKLVSDGEGKLLLVGGIRQSGVFHEHESGNLGKKESG